MTDSSLYLKNRILLKQLQLSVLENLIADFAVDALMMLAVVLIQM